MKTLLKKGLTLSLVTLVTISATGVLRAEEQPVATEPLTAPTTFKVFDVAVVRPCAFGLTCVGGALFLVTWPFTAAAGDSDETYHFLVQKPADIAFNRKQGRSDTLPSGTKVLYSPRNQ